MSTGKNHPYHILPLSAWPIVTAFSALIIVIGTVLQVNNITPVPLCVGLALLLGASFGWFRDMVNEAEHEKVHTKAVQNGIRTGMVLFIISEIMFFAGFFWAFFDVSLFPKAIIGGQWPPKNIETINPFRLPYLNTLLLLLSGTTITWAHQSLLENDRPSFKKGLLLTVTLGLIFLSVQAVEYAHAPFSLKDSIFGSIFYITTGFHGFHVLIGVIMLSVCLLRGLYGHFTPKHHVGFEISAWYWHFVDVVWLFLFVWVYLWGRSH